MVKFMIHGVTDELITLTSRSFAQIFIAQYSLVYGPNTPMWFVPCFFLTECIYYMITEIENRRVRLLVIILTVLFGWFTESQYCPVDFSIMPWNFNSACFALGFYAIGNLYGKKGILLLKNDERFRVSRLVLILLGIVILGILSQYNGHVSLGSRVLNNGLVFYTTGIVGTFVIFVIADALKNSMLLRFWGENSFYIMATHNVLISYIFILGRLILNTSDDFQGYGFFSSILILSLVMTMCSGIAVLYRKYSFRLQALTSR